jgi:hypothetical protein
VSARTEEEEKETQKTQTFSSAGSISKNGKSANGATTKNKERCPHDGSKEIKRNIPETHTHNLDHTKRTPTNRRMALVADAGEPTRGGRVEECDALIEVSSERG